MAILRDHSRSVHPSGNVSPSVAYLMREGRSRLGRTLIACTLSLAILVGITSTLKADPTAAPEYLIKAAFLFNFTKFVEWPPEAFKDGSSPVNLCILGKDPFGEALRSIRDKTVKGRRLSVRYVSRSEEITGCHILFIGASEKENLRQIMGFLKGSPILTVSDTEKFVERGGIINFIMVENKIKFEINPDAAQQCGLKISSQLLKLAKIVTSESRKERE